MSLSEFLEEIQVSFHCLVLYESAFTHSSYSNERKLFCDYEQLEFFGDSLIGFVVSEYLYKNWKKLGIVFSPGSLSKFKHFLVSDVILAKAAKRLQFQKCIITSKNIAVPENNTKIMASVFEALLSAIYLDQNLQTAKDFLIKNLILPFFPRENQIVDNCQELEQIILKNPHTKILYSETKIKNNFIIVCRYCDYETQGQDKNKKNARQKAAAAMLFLLQAKANK